MRLISAVAIALLLAGCGAGAPAEPVAITPGQPFAVDDATVTVGDVSRCEGEAQVSLRVTTGPNHDGAGVTQLLGLYDATVVDGQGVTRPVGAGSAVTYMCGGERLADLPSLEAGRTYEGQVYLDAPAGVTVELPGSDGVTRTLVVAQ